MSARGSHTSSILIVLPPFIFAIKDFFFLNGRGGCIPQASSSLNNWDKWIS